MGKHGDSMQHHAAAPLYDRSALRPHSTAALSGRTLRPPSTAALYGRTPRPPSTAALHGRVVWCSLRGAWARSCTTHKESDLQCASSLIG